MIVFQVLDEHSKLAIINFSQLSEKVRNVSSLLLDEIFYFFLILRAVVNVHIKEQETCPEQSHDHQVLLCYLRYFFDDVHVILYK